MPQHPPEMTAAEAELKFYIRTIPDAAPAPKDVRQNEYWWSCRFRRRSRHRVPDAVTDALGWRQRLAWLALPSPGRNP